MGWLAVAFGFGLSFGVVSASVCCSLCAFSFELGAVLLGRGGGSRMPCSCLHLPVLPLYCPVLPLYCQVIMKFGYISAHLNPATCLALWVIGKVGRAGRGVLVWWWGACAVLQPSSLPPAVRLTPPRPRPPALCLRLCCLQISFTHFLALSAAEFAGAFLGACLVRERGALQVPGAACSSSRLCASLQLGLAQPAS